MNLTEILSGNGRSVLSLTGVGGRCKVLEFVKAQDLGVQEIIGARIEIWIKEGNRGVEDGQWNWLNKGKDKIEEWTPDKHTRIVWFEDKGTIVLVHGYRKNRQDAPRNVIDTAVRSRRQYFEAKKRNRLVVD